MNKLSDIEIMNIMKDIKFNYHFGGFYCNYQNPKELKQNKFYVVNLQYYDTDWTIFLYNTQLSSIFLKSYGFIIQLDDDVLVESSTLAKIKPYILNNNDSFFYIIFIWSGQLMVIIIRPTIPIKK